MSSSIPKLFIGFAAEDRYSIAEPLVYHLKNYGIDTWYDRHKLLLSDNRREKNLVEGAGKCIYAIIILSKHTIKSSCAMEEISIIEKRYFSNVVTVFPILYEISPNEIPCNLQWIKELIFKEVDRHSGTREICNHIACKITNDLLNSFRCKNIQSIINTTSSVLPSDTYAILNSYLAIDSQNLNSRVALLYAAYLTIIHIEQIHRTPIIIMTSKIFERLFSETRLNLAIDYRELWLLENSICILINYYFISCTESST